MGWKVQRIICCCLLYTSDAADERSSVDLGGRRIIKKKKSENMEEQWSVDKRADRSKQIRLDKESTENSEREAQ